MKTTNQNLKSNTDKSKDTDVVSSKSVSLIINPSDVQIIKNKSGADEILGTGHFGVVKRALWTTFSGSKV
jgi:hypothetical protein